ncbi:hypothetical protein DK058_25140 [Salmonella enterica subsp. enterica serovar Typhi]|nr:hypothetical protein [Salmonella enterica subsp. enterica serovar Typhi]
MASIRALSGRGEAFEVTLNQARMTIIDHAYNANPGSMLAALEHLGAMGGRRVAILGEMAELGPNSRSYHTALAEAVNRLGIERVHAMGQLYDEFWANLSPQRRGLRLESVDGVKELLGSDLAAGDVVLVKGSHSTGMHKVVDWIKRAGSNVTILDA